MNLSKGSGNIQSAWLHFRVVWSIYVLLMSKQNQLIEFLQQELLVPADAIALSLRQSGSATYRLPMVLWQYGFVTIHQLNEIFDWLESRLY